MCYKLRQKSVLIATNKYVFPCGFYLKSHLLPVQLTGGLFLKQRDWLAHKDLKRAE
jgi:hypothetical protein